MIVYELGCGDDHRFEGWFGSSEDFERQQIDKLLACPLCGSVEIRKLPHASYVNTGATEPKSSGKTAVSPRAASQQYANLDSEVLAKVIEHIIENTEDVGPAFPEEARKIHYREAPERHIRGTASLRDVSALKEEGIEIVAVPVPPHRTGTRH